MEGGLGDCLYRFGSMLPVSQTLPPHVYPESAKRCRSGGSGLVHETRPPDSTTGCSQCMAGVKADTHFKIL